MAARYDWLNIKKEYVTGEITYEELAGKHGIRFKTLAERAASEEWVKEREKYREEIERITLEKAAKKKAKEMQKAEKSVNKVCDKLLDKISELIVNVRKAGDVKSLTSALTDIQKLKGIKSEEDRKEQAARIRVLLHSVEKDVDKGPETVKIIIEGNEEFAD